jgi:hypothetical protein
MALLWCNDSVMMVLSSVDVAVCGHRAQDHIPPGTKPIQNK